jgi:hypothetical protein
MDGKGVEPYRYVNRLNLKRPFPKGVVFFCPRKLQPCNFPEICLAILRKKTRKKFGSSEGENLLSGSHKKCG